MDSPSRPEARPIELATHAAVHRPGLRLEPSTRTLHGEAAAVVIEPRVMQLLLALADAEGRVVAREALLQAGWGAVVVSDDALHRAVAGARRALRDAGASAWTIDSIARVGYRLRHGTELAGAAVGDLSSGAGPSTATPPTAPPASPEAAPTAWPLAKPARRRWLALGSGLVAAAGLASAGVISWRARQQREAASALVARARQALREASPPAHQRAAQLLEQAAGLQPADAAVWGLLALARRAAADAVAPDALGAALDAAGAAISRALALDPHQPDALCARAQLVPTFGQWGRAEAALRTVLDRSLGHLPSLDSLALLLSGAGIMAEHYPIRLRTTEGDPLHAGYNFRSVYSHWMNGRLAAADQAAERGLELWPGHLASWLARTSLLAFTGRAERALAMLDTPTASRVPPPLVAQLRLTWTALASGQASHRAAARAGVLAGLSRGGPLLAVSATIDLTALGDVETALQIAEAYLLERGTVPAGTSWRPGQTLHVDVRRRFTNHLFLPVCEPLRAHPRFAGLMREAGLEAFWSASGRTPEHLRAS
jgi:DNA-binding winged helix-turn-helix (wHTH) protein/tetratricopeptide (TPR) repeat protein